MSLLLVRKQIILSGAHMPVGQNQWHHFGGRCFIHFRTYFSGWIESDVHWGNDLAFEPTSILHPGHCSSSSWAA